ncbi:hypothetical protein BH10ACT1_BH10ACT1_12660 [soil metagenome]
MPPTTARPSPLGEWAALGQLPRLAWRTPSLVAGQRGTSTVVVLPGRGVNDASTAPLRAYLRALGHPVQGWGLGVNDGEVERQAEAVVPLVQRLVDQAGEPIALVGQSMGGTVARQVARRRPELVSRIVTLGTPLFRTRSSQPFRCPVTAIYSEADRIVRPEWAIDADPAVEHVKVTSTHFGMGIDPDVWRIVADRLALAT